MTGKNNLTMNKKVNMYPSRSFDLRQSKITPSATNMNATPLFYIDKRVNKLWSSTSPNSPNTMAVMRFGNTLYDIFGNNKNVRGNLIPSTTMSYPNLNLTVDIKGNYKLMDLNGKSHKIYSNSNGNYVKYNKQQIYL